MGISRLSRAASPWGLCGGLGGSALWNRGPRLARAVPLNPALWEGTRGAWRLGARLFIRVASAAVRAVGTVTAM